jgi:hypothetical protein
MRLYQMQKFLFDVNRDPARRCLIRIAIGVLTRTYLKII